MCATGQEGISSLMSWDGPEKINKAGSTVASHEDSDAQSSKKVGFVVKVRSGHESRGVYVMESGFGGIEQLSGQNMTQEEVVGALRAEATTLKTKRQKNGEEYNFHVEELLPGPEPGVVPTDYKFYGSNGEIMYVAIITNRGTDQKCTALVDENFVRVDEFGCFELNWKKQPPLPPGQRCGLAANSSRPFKGHSRCSNFRRPPEWDLLLAMAKKMSRIIGIFARIDLYLHHGEVVLGEATFRPVTGQYHCFSKLDDTGCVDPCIMGRFLKSQNELFSNDEGGPIPPEPEISKEWRHLSDEEKCQKVMEVNGKNMVKMQS